MTKYITDLVSDFLNRKSGIEKNANMWQGIPVINKEEIDASVAELKLLEKQIDESIEATQQLRAKARILVEEKKKAVVKIDNFAYGLHNDDATQLLSYGITLKRSATTKSVPTKGVVKSIIDDYDGEGFILERETIQDADNYEWQKAKGDDASVTNIDESKFTHFKVSRLRSFVDDEVKKGVRYFYRFRAFNTTGHGAWSEPVSRVQ
jgi:hypothetical protein